MCTVAFRSNIWLSIKYIIPYTQIVERESLNFSHLFFSSHSRCHWVGKEIDYHSTINRKNSFTWIYLCVCVSCFQFYEPHHKCLFNVYLPHFTLSIWQCVQIMLWQRERVNKYDHKKAQTSAVAAASAFKIDTLEMTLSFLHITHTHTHAQKAVKVLHQSHHYIINNSFAVSSVNDLRSVRIFLPVSAVLVVSFHLGLAHSHLCRNLISIGIQFTKQNASTLTVFVLNSGKKRDCHRFDASLQQHHT